MGGSISYSLSPRLHNAAAQYLDRDAAYVPLALSNADTIPALIRALESVDNCIGFNVTQPFKQTVAEYFSLKSVNTVYRQAKEQGNKFAATSTDAEGFWQAVQQAFKPTTISKLILLGNGGAALALYEYWREKFPSCPIQALRRDASRDHLLQRSLPANPSTAMPLLEFTPAALASALAGDTSKVLLVQATSAVRQGDLLARFIPALQNFTGIYIELDYDCHSALYEHVKAKDLRHQDGLPMLIEQARLAQQLWWGEAAPSAYLHDCLRSTGFVA
ncbi:MAG: hypothetical protein OYH77_07550 [Pseudomonadota bacterium]|nr:hypothetical protein [Pseudomonadota bacterium]